MPIAIDRLGFGYGSRTLFDGFSCELHEGRVSGFVGPSGSGKSTLLALIAGAEQPMAGTIHYPEALRRGSSLARERVAWMTQTAPLMLRRTALANVALPLHGRGVDHDRRVGLSMDALDHLGIGELAGTRCAHLSGGERQRVAMARALASDVVLLITDEPTSALDKLNRSLLLSSLRAVAERGAIVIVATHDPAVVASCDFVVDLEERALPQGTS